MKTFLNLEMNLKNIFNSRNLLIFTLFGVLINVLILSNPQINKTNGILSDLYYLNSENIEENTKNLNKKIAEAINNKLEENSISTSTPIVLNVNKKNLDLSKNLEKERFVSLQSLEVCNKKCMNILNENVSYCLEKCINECTVIDKNHIINYEYVILLSGIFLAFVISFVLFLKNNTNKFNIYKDYRHIIKNHLLEGYELI